MHNMMIKEIRLSASPLSFLFIPFGLMFLLPGYPILCGAFFVCLGIFQSFQSAREANDIVYSALLPVAKTDVVRSKYLFVCLIQCCSLILMAVSVIIRGTVLSEAAVYRSNALMNANLFALGCAFLIYGLFNWIFVGGFFRTAYRFAKPFVIFIAAAFAVICAAETLHHIPGLEALNAFAWEHFPLQAALAAGGAAVWGILTAASCRKACGDFERIDL